MARIRDPRRSGVGGIASGFKKAISKPAARPAPPIGGVSGIAGRGGRTAPVSGGGARNVAPTQRTASSGGYRAPARQNTGYSRGGGGGGYVGSARTSNLGATSTGQVAPIAEPVVPPPPPPPTEEEWRQQDSTYIGEEASLKAELQKLLGGIKDQRVNYQTDFGKSLRNLGWNWQDANNDGLPDDPEIKGGAWNPQDQQGAYGQSYQNQLNDFTGRGMLDSTFYADAQTELDRGFGRQYNDMLGSRNNYLKELLSQETGAKDSNAAAIRRAQAEANERRALKFGL